MKRTIGERLKGEINYLASINAYDRANDEPLLRHLGVAHDLLARLAPETMTHEQIAGRWPRILTAMIVESLGYFSPSSAANALLAYKLGRPFGCEYYCYLAGFERDGWPSDPKEYDAKLREAGLRQLRRSVQCVAGRRSDHDTCHFQFETPTRGRVRCMVARGWHSPDAYSHPFVQSPEFGQHRNLCGQRHYKRSSDEWAYARQLVGELAAGRPTRKLASWF